MIVLDGNFLEEILLDHKIEFSKGGWNEIDNLEVLCLDCQKYLFDSVEIDAGVCQMEDIKE